MMTTVPTLHEEIIGPTSSENPRNGEGDIISLRDGRLLLAWGRFRGPRDHAPADIYARFSKDGGYTWDQPFLLQENVGRCNVMCAAFLRLRSGDLLFGFAIKNDRLTDSQYYVRRSQDEGQTWSAPILTTPEEGYFVVINDRLVQTSSGRLLVPVAKSIDECYHCISSCFLSDDDGESWYRSADYMDIPTTTGLQEPGIVECADGSLWMHMRTHRKHIYSTRSTDGGESWTTPEPTGLVAPLSPAMAKRLPDSDDILMIYNDRSGVRDPDDPSFSWRTPLVSAVSSDGGRTWQHQKLVEADQTKSYCYTSIEFYKDTTLLTYYVGKAGGPNLQDMKLKIVPTSAWTQ